MRKNAALITAVLLLVMQPHLARAHKVSLFVFQENGAVYTEAYFVDGTPCRNAVITATDADGTVVAEGLTDDEGLFSFPCGLESDLTIAVRASMGHGSEILLPAAEPEAREGLSTEEDSTGSATKGVSTAGGSPSLDEAAVMRIVEDRIRPVRDSVRDIQKNQGKPTVGKIIGGLGWIIGLAGAYLWGAARRKNRA